MSTNYCTSICDIHNILQQETEELQELPFPCKSELELRVGTLEYSPHNQQGKFCNGVTEEIFNNVVRHFEPEDCTSEEVWDHIYRTVDTKSNVRVSKLKNGTHTSCICKTWIKHVELEQCLGTYDVRLNLCREINCAMPSSEKRAYVRHKQRISVLLCANRWRLDMTRVFTPKAKPHYEIELEACDVTPFVSNVPLLQSDIDHCLNLLKPYMVGKRNESYNTQTMYNYLPSTPTHKNQSFFTSSQQRPPLAVTPALAKTIGSLYQQFCSPPSYHIPLNELSN